MIKHICPICKRFWYCKGSEWCEKERKRKRLGSCKCPECEEESLIYLKCKAISYERVWRIA